MLRNIHKFPACGKKQNGNYFLLDIDADQTHDCHNNYIKYRASCIIMLVSSLEAFLNHIIPNDYMYHTIRKNLSVSFNKSDIESSKVSFREKLINIIPNWLEDEQFWDSHNLIKEILLELYENRKNIIHLKTNSDSDFDRYFPVIDKMLDFDLFRAINSTVKFMNLVKFNFVEIE